MVTNTRCITIMRLVVREESLEEVVYALLKNNVEVYQIRNLGEKIKLYEGEADL